MLLVVQNFFLLTTGLYLHDFFKRAFFPILVLQLLGISIVLKVLRTLFHLLTA